MLGTFSFILLEVLFSSWFDAFIMSLLETEAFQASFVAMAELFRNPSFQGGAGIKFQLLQLLFKNIFSL
jgi:hypothetical protein